MCGPHRNSEWRKPRAEQRLQKYHRCIRIAKSGWKGPPLSQQVRTLRLTHQLLVTTAIPNTQRTQICAKTRMHHRQPITATIAGPLRAQHRRTTTHNTCNQPKPAPQRRLSFTQIRIASAAWENAQAARIRDANARKMPPPASCLRRGTRSNDLGQSGTKARRCLDDQGPANKTGSTVKTTHKVGKTGDSSIFLSPSWTDLAVDYSASAPLCRDLKTTPNCSVLAPRLNPGCTAFHRRLLRKNSQREPFVIALPSTSFLRRATPNLSARRY